MHRSLFAFVPLCIGFLACGGSAFTDHDDDGGGQGGAGGSATTTSTSTTTGTSTSTTTGPGPITGPGTSGVTTGSSGGGAGSSTVGSGGNGQGGSGGSGGTGGSGGQVVDARPDAPIACDAGAPSPVTFRMSPAPGTSYCVNDCSNIWVSILRPGEATPFIVSRGCNVTCDVCPSIPCAGASPGAASDPSPGPGAPLPPDFRAGCIPPQPVKPQGEMYTWDGVLWSPSHCGAAAYACVNHVCGTPPGKYIARMCANRRTTDAGNFCMSDPTMTCVDVPFDYPATGVVEGVLR